MQDTYSLVLTGQCLIKRDVRGVTAAGFEAVRNLVRSADNAFTNFEGAIRGSLGGAPTKTEYLSAVPPAVLDSLQDIGFDLLSLCNNHAFDYGAGGVQSTIAETSARGFTTAGAGGDLDEAGAIGYAGTAGPVVGLIAMDCGPQDEQVYARNASPRSPARVGINPMRLRERQGNLVPDEADLQRNQEAVTAARSGADLVVVYTHSHHWSPRMWETPAAMAELSRGWIEAGADVVVGHGTPAFQGIEVYRGKPIFHGLGNFIFHSWRPQRWFESVGLLPWQGVVARCTWARGTGVTGIELTPIGVGHDGDLGEAHPEDFHDFPVVASGDYGAKILDRMADLSGAFGTVLEFRGSHAILALT